MKEQTFKALEEAGIQDTALLVKRRIARGHALAYYTEAGEYINHQNGEVLTITEEQAAKGAVVIRAGDNLGVFSFEEAGLSAEDGCVVHGYSQDLPAFDTYEDAEYVGINDQGNVVSFDKEAGEMTDNHTYQDYYEDDDGMEYSEEVEAKKDETFLYGNFVFLDADENIVVDPKADNLSRQQVRERLIANEDKLAHSPRLFLKAILNKYQREIDGADETYTNTTAMREAILLNNTLNPLPDEMPGEGVRLSPMHEKRTKEEFFKAHPDLICAVDGTRDLGSSMMAGMGDAIYQRARLIYAGATQTPMKDIRMTTGYSDGGGYDDYDDYDDGVSYSAVDIFQKVVEAGGMKKDVPEGTSNAVAALYGRAPNSGEGSVQIELADLDGMSFMLVNDGMSGDIVYQWPTTPFLVSDADYEDELEYMAQANNNADPAQPAPGQGWF